MKTLVLLPFLFIGLANYAQEATPRVDRHEKEQRARIHQGRVNGELTHKESARLNAQQRHIHQTERTAKVDGRVTRSERNKLHREQHRASRNIRRQKHDGQTKNFQ